jgi:hypothetical protein
MMNGSHEKIKDLKIFLLCISSGAIGFSLIGILPYDIPLFLRVTIAFLFLGIPLLDPKKIVLFGIAGGVGFFIKDFIFWDLFSFKWTTQYGINVIDISVLTGLMIGIFLSVVLWNRKAIKIFPLTAALTFFTTDFIKFVFFWQGGLGELGAGLVFGAGMCYYLLSIKKTPSLLRNILLTSAIFYLVIFGSFMIIGRSGIFEHPSHLGNTVVPVGEVVEKEGKRIAVTNYTFLQNNTGRILKAVIQSPDDVNNLRLYFWCRQDEYTGLEIIGIGGHLEKAENSTSYYFFSEILPERVRTKDVAVIWEVWMSRGIEYVIWRTK